MGGIALRFCSLGIKEENVFVADGAEELQAQGPAHLADLNCVSEQLLEVDLVLVPWEILLQAPRGKEFHDEFNPTSS